MKIILLSGGSGKRLWPLSNDARSKQFLRVLRDPEGRKESMIQRVVRQIRRAHLTDEIIVATGHSQRDAVEVQIDGKLSVVTEPMRRDTFPAIALACTYLKSQGVPDDEPVIVMPCDTYTEDWYFHVLGSMAKAAEDDNADLVLMGIHPTYPSSKYGYIMPARKPAEAEAVPVRQFIEKPDVPLAERLIANGALWNGGVFAFRLGKITENIDKYVPGVGFEELRERYSELPRISFDYEVVEKAKSVAVVPYDGDWRDLGTWNTLTDELREKANGNVILENCDNTYVLNELGMPIVCIGADNLVVAASPDGILVSDRKQCENLKHLVDGLNRRPMYEERRWGEYRVIDTVEFDDGFCALTKQLTLKPGACLSYQRHTYREEVWTFIDGEGEIVLDGERRPVRRGDVIRISKGQWHTLRADTRLTFIEVQEGSNLVEEDIERQEYQW